MIDRSLLFALAVAFALLVSPLGGAAVAGSATFLPGDDTPGLSAQTQDWTEIAAGGPGFLAVWEENRTNISGNVFTAGSPLTGNGVDIYGALLDEDGNILESPIVIANQGMNQTRPRVAWNGQNWLVVWMTQRPDWYFFDDIVAVRVSPTGEVLDPEPLPIRLEKSSPNNNAGDNPRLASDGTNWLVVWEDFTYEGQTALQNISGRRIAPDGSFLDPHPVVLYQFDSYVFGPEDPQLAWATDEYLLVWEELGTLFSQRFDASLAALDPQPTQFGDGVSDPRLATNGAEFLVISRENRAFRIDHGNVPLDPMTGIDFDTLNGTGWQPSGGAVAWEGANWALVFPSAAGPFDDSELYLVRLATDGSILPPGAVLVQGSTDEDWKPALAGAASGGTQLAWSQRPGALYEDVRTMHLPSGATSGEDIDLGIGLSRQTYPAFASNGSEHLLVFLSEGDRQRRLLSQRLDASGQAIDLEPTEITRFSSPAFLIPDVAFDGTHYLVIWWDLAGNVWGQRLDASNNLVDPQPVKLVNRDSAQGAAVGALGGDFLLVYTYQFSGDQQYLKAARVDGSTLELLDTPFYIGFDFALDPEVVALGQRWLVVWEDQTRHDVSSSQIAAVWVDADGTATPSFRIDEGGYGDDPDVAVAGDRALVTWSDNLDYGDDRIEARILLANGAFLASEFLVADDLEEQILPAAGWNGSEFTVAWADYRTIPVVEHMRADIWAARVATDGTVLDPAGMQLTSGPLSEDLPAVVGADGSTLVVYDALSGVSEPEVPRLAVQLLGGGSSFAITASGNCGGPVEVEVSNAPPNSEVALVAAANTNGFVLQGRACPDTVFEIGEPFRLPPTFVKIGASGDGSVTLDLPTNRCWIEALAFADCSTSRAIDTSP